jgi:hypothetical protein
MRNKKVTLLFASAFTLILVVSAAVLYKTPVDAARYMVKDGNLLLVSESLNAGKQITNSKDVQILFDESKSKLLIGRGIKGNVPDSEPQGGTELYIMNVDGTDSKKLSDTLVTEAFFSHDGTKAYYVTNEKTLYDVTIETGEITKIQEKIFEVGISHDDTRLVYHKLNADWILGDYYENALGIAVLDLSTNIETQLTDGWDDFSPRWTPNDKSILYAATNENGIVSQFIVDVDSAEIKQLTNFGQEFVTDKTVGYINGVAPWSEDGHSIAFEGDNEIWVYTFADDYKSASGKKIAFGKAPKWIDNDSLSIVVTETTDSKKAFIKIDKRGNIIK